MLDILTIIGLALAVSAISVTVTKGGVFRGLRQWFIDRNDWMGRLVSCPYCLSHWVSLLLVILYRTQLSLVGIGVTAFAVVAVAAIISGIITTLFPFEQQSDQETIAQLTASLQYARKVIDEVVKTVEARKEKERSE